MKAGAKTARQPMDDDDDDGDEYEYGDSIAHAREENPADFSVHQFLAKDDARGVEGSDDDDDNSANEGGDDGAAEAVKDASQDDDDHWNSEMTPEEDTSFLSVKEKSMKAGAKSARQPMDDDDDGDDYEYGDSIAH